MLPSVRLVRTLLLIPLAAFACWAIFKVGLSAALVKQYVQLAVVSSIAVLLLPISGLDFRILVRFLSGVVTRAALLLLFVFLAYEVGVLRLLVAAASVPILKCVLLIIAFLSTVNVFLKAIEQEIAVTSRDEMKKTDKYTR